MTRTAAVAMLTRRRLPPPPRAPPFSLLHATPSLLRALQRHIAPKGRALGGIGASAERTIATADVWRAVRRRTAAPRASYEILEEVLKHDCRDDVAHQDLTSQV